MNTSKALFCYYLFAIATLSVHADEQKSVKNSLIECATSAQKIKFLVSDLGTKETIGYSGKLAHCIELKSKLCSFFNLSDYKNVRAPVSELSSCFATSSFFALQFIAQDGRKETLSYRGGYIYWTRSDSWSILTHKDIVDISMHIKALFDTYPSTALLKTHYAFDMPLSQQKAFYRE